ncbi:MAG: MarR family winged helix-turn-helix transcriptional regulator [Rhodothermaceae bacterium]
MTAKELNTSSRLISVASRLLAARLQEDFSTNEIDITVEQWRILFYLWEEDGINQNELAKRADKEKSTMTRQIEALEKKDLIFRESHSSDKRNKLIYLTRKGKKLEKQAMGIADSITVLSEKGITKKDMEVFKKVMIQVITNIKD